MRCDHCGEDYNLSIDAEWDHHNLEAASRIYNCVQAKCDKINQLCNIIDQCRELAKDGAIDTICEYLGSLDENYMFVPPTGGDNE